ncbi:MAG: hypothetical protein ACK4QL_08700 [Pseudanabaenaceae cyanobacterium]
MTTPKKPIRPEKPRLDIVRVAPPPAVKTEPPLEPGDKPISPPTEPLQYRAIGLIKGRYVPSPERIARGQLLAEDGTTIEAYVLGKLISIVKKRLDMSQSHLWVVYPRTQEKAGEQQLFVQIAGVWAPQALGKPDQPSDPGIPDGYFSVRGEVIKVAEGNGLVTVKIRRLTPVKSEQKTAPTSDQPKPKSKKRPYIRFKLHLWGLLPKSAVGQFWDINVHRKGTKLVITDGQAIAPIKKFTRKPAPKPKKPSKPQFKHNNSAGVANPPPPQLRPRPPKPKI